MTRQDEYATTVYLKEPTLKELKTAIEFYKKMEKDLNREPENSKWRLSNLRFDRDKIIREVLEDFND